MFPESGNYKKAYKCYYTQKMGSNIRTISYSDGGHGVAFSIVGIKEGVVSVLTDSRGTAKKKTVDDKTKWEGEGLRVSLLKLNYGGLSWDSYASYTDTDSSADFGYKFGCYTNRKNYSYDDQCYNTKTYTKIEKGKKITQNYKETKDVNINIALTAYDPYNDVVAFWSHDKNTKKIKIYKYSALQKTVEFEGDEGLDIPGVSPVSSISTDDFGSIYRQGIAIHRGVVYGLWGKPAQLSAKSINWYIRGYDMMTGDTVYQKDIKYDDVKGIGNTYSQLEPEGIQVKTDSQGNSYIHIGIARVLKDTKNSKNDKYDSSIYRFE